MWLYLGDGDGRVLEWIYGWMEGGREEGGSVWTVISCAEEESQEDERECEAWVEVPCSAMSEIDPLAEEPPNTRLEGSV